MKSLFSWSAALALMLGLGLFGSVVQADDDDARDERPRRQRLRIVDRAAGKYWIGVHAVPVDDALKAHLKLEDRLIVHGVMPESPAAKGGLARHDILLKFGDREINNLKDLLQAVSANKDKAVKIVVLRGGEETTLDIQPTKRPADVELNSLVPQLDLKALEGWLGSPAGGRFRMIGPGVSEELPALPGNLSISVTKQDDEPAKITVKRDGKTWEITEDGIDELPEEIREHVRRRLDGHRDHPRHLQWRMMDEDGTIHLDPLWTGGEGANGVLRDQLERAQQQLEKLQQRLGEADPFKALRQEIKALREEVEKLRQRDQPQEPAATDSTDA